MRFNALTCALALSLLPGAVLAEDSAWTLLERGIKAYQKQDYRRSGELLEAALRHDARCQDAHYYLGLLAEKKRDTKAAAGHYREVGKDSPMFSLCAERLGHLELAAGHKDKAADHFQVFAEARPTTASWMQLAAVQIDLERFEQAAKSLEEAAKYSKGNLDLVELRGRLYMETERYTAALDEYTTYLKVIPKDTSVRYLRGSCLLELGRDDEARKEFERVVEENPWHGLTLRVLVQLLEDEPGAAARVQEYRRRLQVLAKNPPKVQPVAGRRTDGAPPAPPGR